MSCQAAMSRALLRPLPNEHADDLSAFGKDRRCSEPYTILGHFDEAFLRRARPVGIPTGLQRVRYKPLLLIDFVAAAITDECCKGCSLLAYGAAHEIRTSEFRSIRGHDTDAHVTVRAVRDDAGRALAHTHRRLNTSGQGSPGNKRPSSDQSFS